ncbi:MAG: YIP1 family protein [Thermodesulfovibrionales bacterium]
MEGKGKNFAAFPQTAIKVLTSPAAFFREMPKTGGFVEPLIFMVVMGVISGLVQAILSLIGLNIAGGIAMGMASIIMMPIFIAIFGFVGAAILFVIWKLMGSQESYETAYRCGAYISAFAPIAAVLSIIPYLGGAAGIVAYTFFLVAASIEVHKIPSQKAWLVFGIIGAILILLSITGQMAAKKLSGELAGKTMEMEKAAKEMEEAAKKMQESASRMPHGGQMTEEQQKQMEEAAKKMEEAMKNMPQKQEKE